MREVLALLRINWLAAISYRLEMVISLVGMIFSIVPIYFISKAIQPVVEESIRTEGGQYLGFVLVGLITLSFLNTAINTLPGSVATGIRSGILEAQLGTPARVPALLLGFISYSFVWTTIRAAVLLVAGVVMGADFAWLRMPAAIAILLLIVLAYLPFGLLSTASVLAFRTETPLNQGVLAISALLGGVYYSTSVIPSWIQHISGIVPLTYGLRALRRALLEGLPLRAVASDLLILVGFAIVLLGVSALAFAHALRYARRSGTLSHY
jgi:ABC-2 type transport system permease protein